MMRKSLGMRKISAILLALSFVGCALVLTLFGSGEMGASASTATYAIKNVTKDTSIVVDYKNDFTDLGTASCSLPAGKIVYFDESITDYDDMTAGVQIKVRSGAGGTACAVLVKKDATKLIVEEVKSTITSGSDVSLTIPAGGYILMGQGGTDGQGAKTLRDNFTALDEVGAISSTPYSITNETIKQTTTISEIGGAPINNAIVIVKEGEKYSHTAVRVTIVATKAVGVEGKFSVTKVCQKTAPETLTVPKDGFIISAHGDFLANTNYKHSSIWRTKVNDILTIDGITLIALPPLETADITVGYGASESLAIDGINPISEDVVLTGKTVLYGASYGTKTVGGLQQNQPSKVKSLPRADETVKEYVVEVAGGVHKITKIADACGEKIPYHGYIISTPKLDMGLSVGDVITLSGADSDFKFPELVVDNVTQNIRLIPTVKNSGSITNAMCLYDSSFGEKDPSSAFIFRAIFEDVSGVKKVTRLVPKASKNPDGSYIKQVDIPKNGNVLIGHSDQMYANMVKDSFIVGDEVEFFDYGKYTNVNLADIKLGGTTITGFSSALKEYYNYVSTTDIPLLVATTEVSGATTAIVTPTSIPGDYEITVTAQDKYHTAKYIVHLKKEADKNFYLNSVKLNGVDIPNFDFTVANQNVYYLAGATDFTLSATAEKSGSQVTITQKTAGSNTAKILVTAEETAYTMQYSITFVAVDLSLKSINIGGEALEGFGSDKKEYSIEIKNQTLTSAPKISAIANDDTASVKIVQSPSTKGSATIEVSKNGLVNSYKISFSVIEKKAGCGATFDINILAILVVISCLAVVSLTKKNHKKCNKPNGGENK